jgi:hypothetical protein
MKLTSYPTAFVQYSEDATSQYRQFGVRPCYVVVPAVRRSVLATSQYLLFGVASSLRRGICCSA